MYYAQPVKGSTVHHEENQAQVLNFVVTPIDKRSIPGEQIESKAKKAFDIIEKYLTDDTKKVWENVMEKNLPPLDSEYLYRKY